MAEIYRIIPESDRPYNWAFEEMQAFNPQKYWITKLEQLSTEPNVHISIFHREGDDYPDIWRVYWSDRELQRAQKGPSRHRNRVGG